MICYLCSAVLRTGLLRYTAIVPAGRDRAGGVWSIGYGGMHIGSEVAVVAVTVATVALCSLLVA